MDAFSQVGYGIGDVGWGRRPAVVAVDLQLAFTCEDFPLGGGEHIRAAVEKAAGVLQVARDAGLLVVHTAVAWSGAREFGRWKIPSLLEITPGSPGSWIDPLVWNDSDTYLLKHYPSAFFGTDLSSVLLRNDVDTVLVMGATTSGCVRATVIDAFSHGFRTLVVADGCGDQSADAHASNLRDVRRRYADVIDARTACEHLTARSSQGPSARYA